MRGKACWLLCGLWSTGITPAHAGKRSCIPCPLSAAWDHPRACGEKTKNHDTIRVKVGSPPRMRGKDCSFTNDTGYPGITPAHAGKSPRRPGRAAIYQDHPRACGEKLTLSCAVKIVLGSPPRMRGKVKLFSERLRNTRITPAHAGKSHR